MSNEHKLTPTGQSGAESIKAGVIGLGYVGLPLVVSMAEAGFKALGVDIADRAVQAILTKKSHVADVPDEQLAAVVDAGKLSATSDFSLLAECDLISICVPTPLRKTREPDLSYILASVEKLGATLRCGQTIILESTTFPGTTEEVVLPQLEEASGLKVGEDFHLAFSPERVDPGRTDEPITAIPKVIGGVTAKCRERAAELYSHAFKTVVPVSSATTAEMVKLLENTFRQVNIGLINETAQICQRLGIDVWEVVDAAKTKPFGFMPFYPGPGLGGHCIPVDPQYLAWKMRSLNSSARFIELASTINGEMPQFVVEQITQALNREGKAVLGADIFLMGVAYKKDVSDVRESPALDITALLAERGAELSYYDPFVPEFAVAASHQTIRIQSEEATSERLARADIVVILADHSMFRPLEIAGAAKLIYDARNVFGKIEVGDLPPSSETQIQRLGDGSRRLSDRK